VLDLSAGEAERLMLEAHTTGHAVVFAGDREAAEQVCVALHTWSLHATVTR
jgi:ATP-dependent Clp protease adapter protein ClpS